MPTPEQAKFIADAGGWAVCILLVSLATVGLHRRWWVPGWVWDQERKDGEVLRDQLDQNTKALRTLAGGWRQDRQLLKDLVAQLRTHGIAVDDGRIGRRDVPR